MEQAARYVALLRGINVGGNRIIKNTDLKKCFERMGFMEVVILLQSGNVIFSAPSSNIPQMKSRIETHLQKTFHYPAKVIVIDTEALKKLVRKYPFDLSRTDAQHYVVFLSEDVGAEMVRSVQMKKNIEEAVSGDHVIYWRVVKGMTLKSDFGKLLSKAKYKELNTVRNVNTLKKIPGVS